jgi:hypothetical protein
MTTLTKQLPQHQTYQNAIRPSIPHKPAGTNTPTPATAIKSFSPKELVPRLGASEQMVRIFLRKHYPQIHVKNKSWNISPEMAKQIETDYKNQIKAREAQKKLRIEKELSGVLKQRNKF